MNALALIGIFLGALAFGCCWFDYQEIKGLKESLHKRTLEIWSLESKIKDLEKSIDNLSEALLGHEDRLHELEGDSYE